VETVHLRRRTGHTVGIIDDSYTRPSSFRTWVPPGPRVAVTMAPLPALAAFPRRSTVLLKVRTAIFLAAYPSPGQPRCASPTPTTEGRSRVFLPVATRDAAPCSAGGYPAPGSPPCRSAGRAASTADQRDALPVPRLNVVQESAGDWS
jgi:hypothetical protein